MRAPRVANLLAANLLALCASFLLSGMGTDAYAADFYAGRTVTMLVGFVPGGGVDATARVVAAHLGDFIPGKPAIVVQNMEGAAGLVAMNYLANRVAADGLTVAVPGRSWYVEGALKGPGVAFDIGKATFIGSPGGVNSGLFVRTATGVDSLATLKSSSRPLTFGTLGANTPTAMVPALLAAQGYPIKIISGYVSTARVLVALEQGELDGFWTAEESFTRRHDLIDKNLIRPILQTRPHLPGVPLLSDVIPPDQKGLLMLLEAPENFGLPVVAPAGVPADRAAILRKAFLAMAADPGYQADARRNGDTVGAPIDGATLQSMVQELAKAATPDIVAAYRRLGAAK